MSARFLSAAYSRRPAPKIYDPLFLNTELSRIAASMTSYVIRNVTAATTMQKNDGMLVCNATAGAITVTLPSPAVGSGQPVTIKKSDATANAITIGGTVDGVLNRTLPQKSDTLVIQSDGTTWFRPILTASGIGDAISVITGGAVTSILSLTAGNSIAAVTVFGFELSGPDVFVDRVVFSSLGVFAMGPVELVDVQGTPRARTYSLGTTLGVALGGAAGQTYTIRLAVTNVHI